MQCPSCAFQNMPGSAGCARCNAMLNLASIAIDVHPPRATGLGKLLQSSWRFRFLGHRLWDWLNSDLLSGWRAGPEYVHLELGTVLRGAVPGWANIHTGHRLQGLMFLGSFLVFALVGIARLGTDEGAVLVGLAFATHTVSLVKATIPAFESYRDRLIMTGVFGGLLALLVYAPLIALASRIAVPLNIQRGMPAFSAGDVVWYHPTAHVAPGQLALWDSPRYSLATRADNGQHAEFRVDPGLRINRVVATEGQRVSWDHGTMLIDGQTVDPPLLPAEYEAVLPKFTVPEGQVLIDPSNLIPGGRPSLNVIPGEVHGQPVDVGVRIDPAVWQNLALVSKDRLLGIVFWRSVPWSRAGFLNSQ